MVCKHVNELLMLLIKKIKKEYVIYAEKHTQNFSI